MPCCALWLDSCRPCAARAITWPAWGGDEFVFTGLGPATGQDGTEAIAGLHQRLERATACHVVLPSAAKLDYPGASIGVVCLDPTSCTVDTALRRADAAMYAVKKLRRK